MSDNAADNDIIDLSDIAVPGDDEIIELSDIVLEDSGDDSVIELSDIAEVPNGDDAEIKVSEDGAGDDDLIEFGEFARGLEDDNEKPGVAPDEPEDENFSIDLDLDMDENGEGFFSDSGSERDMEEHVMPAQEEPAESVEASDVDDVAIADTGDRLFTDEQLEDAVERVITRMFSEKMDRLLNAAIEKVVTGEIEKIKRDLLDQNHMDS